ncbi:MAG: NAD(P)-dependent oxidoreductase [Bacteroidota bacterium]|nr:NAD(P)-dependent oxidoreductase [Bacteroidota bacterium]MDP4249213.1 NAD(P)-dependent oxidoreductase [Bacteroidota bacterium]
MKVILIGATGFVGSAILKEALERGHLVTAILRHPEKLTVTHKNLSVKQGDVMDTDKLTELIKGNEVMVSAYNPGWSNPEIYNDFLKGARSIQSAAKKSGIKRLLVIGGAGSSYIAPNLQLIDTPEFPAEWKPGALAARDYLNILKKEDQLDWTFVTPAIEMHHGTSGTRKGVYRTGLENPVFDANKRSVISVEDLALAVVDEVEKPKHIRQRFTLAY